MKNKRLKLVHSGPIKQKRLLSTPEECLRCAKFLKSEIGRQYLKKWGQIIKEIANDIQEFYSTARKKKRVHVRIALAIILAVLSTGMPYGIYENGGIKRIMPSQLLAWTYREYRSDKKVQTIKSRKDTTFDSVGQKDMDDLRLKGESQKGIVLFRKEVVKQKKTQPPISEETTTEEGRHRTLKEADAITNIKSHMEGNMLKIILTGDGAITKYTAFSLDDPTRLIIDVFKITKTLPQRLIKINSPYVDRIRIGTHPDKVRLCLDFPGKELPPHYILNRANRLVIVMGKVGS